MLPTASNAYTFFSTVTRTQPDFIPDSESFLITNSDGNNIVRYNPLAVNSLGEFIPAESGGLFKPDSVIVGPDAKLLAIHRLSLGEVK